MPAYDYRCTACDHNFEVTKPMGTDPQESCPLCGEPARRVFTPVGVTFKGSGFHNTDYKPRQDTDTPSCPAKKDSGGCDGCPAAD